MHFFLRMVLGIIAAISMQCMAQLAPPPAPEAPPAANWSNWLGPAGSGRIRARLRDQSAYAAQHSAAVEVEVQNIFLTSVEGGTTTSAVPRGLLQYQVDDCPTVVTTDTRLRFDHLAAGKHAITVSVIGLDNRQITPQVKLQVDIPQK